MLALALALSLAAQPEEPAVNEVIDGELKHSCGADAGAVRWCALLKAFRGGKPVTFTKPMFIIGTYDEPRESGISFLDLTKEGAVTAGLTPDDEAEKQKFLAIAAGKKDPLSDAVAKEAKKMPHLPTKTFDGSLFFQENVPLGGHWLRASGGKWYLLQIGGDLEGPTLRVSELVPR